MTPARYCPKCGADVEEVLKLDTEDMEYGRARICHGCGQQELECECEKA